MNTIAVAGTHHTLTCTLENFNSSGIPLLYTWSIASQRISTCTSEHCVIHTVQFTDARTDYHCEVRRHDDNVVIAISDNSSLKVSSKFSIIYPFTCQKSQGFNNNNIGTEIKSEWY